MREFDSGAIRDTAENKPSYAGFFSPLVLKRYGEYMLKHQKMPNGEMRNADNWKGLFGKDHMKVCHDSKKRHDMDLDLIMDGYPELSRDSFEDVLCAIMFNTMAMLYKIEKDKYETSEVNELLMEYRINQIKNEK